MVYKHDIFLLNFFVSTQPTYMKQDIKKMSGWDILHFVFFTLRSLIKNYFYIELIIKNCFLR